MIDEIEKKQTELEYQAAHTFKNNFWRGFDIATRDLVVDSLAALWALRRHPHYYKHSGISDVEAVFLHELIGFDVPGSELFAQSWYHFCFYQSKRDRNRTAPAPALTIPDVTNTFTKGILTDVARETKRVVLGQLRQYEELRKCGNEVVEERFGYPPTDPKKLIQDQGLDIDVQRFINIYADSHAYVTFLIGFYLPHLRESCGLVKQALEGRLSDPVSYVGKVLGLDLRSD